MSRLHFPYLPYFYATVVYGTEISLLSGVLCLGIVGGFFARLVCPALSYSVLLCQRGMQRTVVVHVRIRIF